MAGETLSVAVEPLLRRASPERPTRLESHLEAVDTCSRSYPPFDRLTAICHHYARRGGDAVTAQADDDDGGLLLPCGFEGIFGLLRGDKANRHQSGNAEPSSHLPPPWGTSTGFRRDARPP